MQKQMPMVKYHPDARFLTDYAAGSLPASQALCVASHLHYCPLCRLKIGELTELGAELFMRQNPVAVAQPEYERLLDRINNLPQNQSLTARPEQAVSLLPKALSKLINDKLERLNWRHYGKNLRVSKLNLGDPQRETSLLCIKAGGHVPHHQHKGDEITVILKGSFSDREDKYEIGDFIVRTKGETHKPVASQDQDCLCLSTLDAPIVMSNWLLRLGLLWLNRRTAVG